MPKSRTRRGVRASIVATKRGNARGAKGRRKVDAVRHKSADPGPSLVPLHAEAAKAEASAGATPDGQTPSRWGWVEPLVWTKRMLAALDDGVKGERLLCQTRAVQPEHRLGIGQPVLSKVRPPTGEPDAGDPPVRFGGRGDRLQSVLPTPISQYCPSGK